MSWINVKDKCPENGQDILFWNGLSVWIGFYDTVSSQNGDFYCDEHYIIDQVTHWIPIPKPPEE